MPGRVVGIHVAPQPGAPMRAVSSAECRTDFGLVGDRYCKHGSKAQVTLVALEQLGEAGGLLGHEIPAGATRRNVTLQGIAIPAPGGRLRLGGILLEITSPADPCGLMDRCILPGAKAALQGRSGFRARVIEGGTLSVGDPVEHPTGHPAAAEIP